MLRRFRVEPYSGMQAKYNLVKSGHIAQFSGSVIGSDVNLLDTARYWCRFNHIQKYNNADLTSKGTPGGARSSSFIRRSSRGVREYMFLTVENNQSLQLSMNIRASFTCLQIRSFKTSKSKPKATADLDGVDYPLKKNKVDISTILKIGSEKHNIPLLKLKLIDIKVFRLRFLVRIRFRG